MQATSTKSITLSASDCFPLVELAKMLPTRPHRNTVRRWASQGVRGVRLRSWMVAGRRVTSEAAFAEFEAALDQTAANQCAHAAAEAELNRLGL